jgi:hypothetical protein
VIASAPSTPRVILYYHSGMDKVLPIRKKDSLITVPRVGQRVTVRFQDSVSFDEMLEEYWREHRHDPEYSRYASLSEALMTEWERPPTPEEKVLYATITSTIHDELKKMHRESL